MTVKTPVKPAGTPPQPEFDYQNHLPQGQEIFSVRELAIWFRTSIQHWLNLIDSGEIKALDLSSPTASRFMTRIPRAEIVRFLNSRLR